MVLRLKLGKNPPVFEDAPKIEATEGYDLDRKECRHHWLVGPPSGKSSPARCKLCGSERVFPTEPDYAGKVHKGD